MDKEQVKKIWKKFLTVFAVLCVLFIMTLGWIVAIGVLARVGNNMYMNDLRAYSYLISGRGCNDMARASDEELTKYIKEDILSQLSVRKFRRILLEEKKGFEEGKYMKDGSCDVMVNRVINIVNGF